MSEEDTWLPARTHMYTHMYIQKCTDIQTNVSILKVGDNREQEKDRVQGDGPTGCYRAFNGGGGL